MYKAMLDGKPLYYPGDLECALTKAMLKRALNDSGTFNITVPVSNPLFDSFKRRISEIVIYKNDEEFWRGEVRKEGLNFKKEKTVYVVGELAYLNASSQPQREIKNKTPQQIMAILLEYHNANVEERKQFQLGIVSVDANYYDWTTNYEGTLDYIRSEICEKRNGYLRIRRSNGVRYLDLLKLQDYGKVSSQSIEFGSNLLDFTSDIDADEIATVVRPLGKKLEESKYEDLDTYITVESVNNGKDCIENTPAIESGIGRVCQTVHFNVLTDPAALYTAGVNWLEDKQFENMELTVSAVDLSARDVEVEELELGDYVHTLATPFGMNRWAYITEDNLDLLNPATKRDVHIGERVKQSYTQQSNSSQIEMEKKIPTESKILTLAKLNATEMITNASKGYVYDVLDENGNRVEQLIMNTNDINTATKVWRWNINGLGYSKNGIDGPYTTAMTMDGGFVADFITVGSLSADRIKGGTITASEFEVSGQIVKYASDYTEADLEIINRKISGSEETTLEDLEKYDLDGDGNITITDLVAVNRLVKGLDASRTINTSAKISPLSSQQIFKTEGVSIGTKGIKTESVKAKELYSDQYYIKVEGSGYKPGFTGTITTADGQNVTVINGMIYTVL